MLEGFRGLHSQSRLLRFLAILAVVPHAHIFLETATDSGDDDDDDEGGDMWGGPAVMRMVDNDGDDDRVDAGGEDLG